MSNQTPTSEGIEAVLNWLSPGSAVHRKYEAQQALKRIVLEARINELERIDMRYWGNDDVDTIVDGYVGKYIAERITQLNSKEPKQMTLLQAYCRTQAVKLAEEILGALPKPKDVGEEVFEGSGTSRRSLGYVITQNPDTWPGNIQKSLGYNQAIAEIRQALKAIREQL